MTDTIRSGYTYAAYHRGRKRHAPTDFIFVGKRLARIAGTRDPLRIRNVWRHPMTGTLYVTDSLGYFEPAEFPEA